MVAAPPETAGAFEGSGSLRVGGEWMVLGLSIAAIVCAAPLLAYFFPILASYKELAVLVIGAMIYLTFARGQLIGGSIRVHPGQFGHVHEIAQECARALRMSTPAVFVRDDPLVPIVAVGIGEPYSLIISAQWVEHLTAHELRFLIGRELAHIEAGHTRITSLLSVNGRENPIISILFGAWLRRIEYTADRAGLLCCASLDGALSAISVSTFHLVGRKIDLAVFAEQQREIEAERALSVGEWISATPYATKRIAALCSFARDALFLQWSARFEQNRLKPFIPPMMPAGAVSPRTFAAFTRRLGAFTIDSILLQALMPNMPLDVTVNKDGKTGAGTPPWLIDIAHHVHTLHMLAGGNGLGIVIALAYYVLFVGFLGQTFGMMVMDLRVVTATFERVSVARAFLRCACFVGSMLALVGFVRIFGRIQPFEKWSGTRLIGGSAYTRARDRVKAAPFEAAVS